MRPSQPLSQTLLHSRWLLPVGLVGALGLGWLAGHWGQAVPGLLLGVPLVVMLVVATSWSPRVGYISFICYCFLNNYVSRHVDDIPVGLAMEGLLVLTWLSTVFYRNTPPNWRFMRNDLCGLTAVWFIINVLELGNPAGASFQGWLNEIRSSALLWLLVVPLGFLVFRQRRDLNVFIYILIGFSVFGALYGIKQKTLGVDAMEQRWLDAGAAGTHILWGRLRVFSNYSEAAQFGCSQAHIALVCGILALGPFSWTKRILLAAAALLLLYGMLISGTRSAFFVIIVGGFVYLALSKQMKVLLVGIMLAIAGYMVLRYTHIGDSNPDVYRMRSALNPEDASLQVRLTNQAKLREYLSTRPFGGGVGVMGEWGKKYNPGTFLSTIPPDSYYVKIWGSYGIVGFVVWFGIMLYILGKCAGIVWRIRDPQLRQKLLALTAGAAGILMASYGNEIMNQMPSCMILYVSWVLVFVGPELDTPALKPVSRV